MAYGKSGLWTAYSGSGRETQAMSCRAYYTWHLAQKRYRCVAVEEILYHDGEKLVDTSTILKRGKERLGRVYVRYQNGFESWANLNDRESWTVEVDGQRWLLPPFGWYQRRKEEWGEFRNYSVIRAGEGRRSRVEDKETVMVVAPGSTIQWQDVETDGTVIILKQEDGRTRVINIDALRLRVKAGHLGLRPAAKQAAFQSFDLEGDAVADGTLSVENGWVDFSFMAQEQFALVMP
jgi:hypothetical protein